MGKKKRITEYGNVSRKKKMGGKGRRYVGEKKDKLKLEKKQNRKVVEDGKKEKKVNEDKGTED